MTPCKVWTGRVNHDGYGLRYYKGSDRRVHRIAWQEANGPIPPGMCVCHYCSAETKRFFRSRPLPSIYHGRFFIDSTVPPNERRKYQIAVAMDDGKIERVRPAGMPVLGYPSRGQALTALARFVAFGA